MDAEIETRRQESYDHELEDRVLDWLEDVSGQTADSLYLACKSGELLCHVVNAIRPGTVAKVHANRVALLERVPHSLYSTCTRE
jgi:hypothetical protein